MSTVAPLDNDNQIEHQCDRMGTYTTPAQKDETGPGLGNRATPPLTYPIRTTGREG